MVRRETTARPRSPHGRSVALLAATGAALVLSSAARGHVLIHPGFVEAGVASEIGFTVPNERRGHVTTSLSVEAPPGVTMTLGQAPPGWSGSEGDREASWTGGRIAGEQSARFLVTVTARTDPGRVVFRATQQYEDGRSVPWNVALTVVPGPEADSPPQHLRRALTAGMVGLVVIAGSLVALRRLRRRGSLQER